MENFNYLIFHNTVYTNLMHPTLKMEAAGYSETLTSMYLTVQHHIPKYCNIWC